MEGVNKIISLFLGLIVVIILFAIVTGRINLKNRLPALSFLNKNKVTPTITPIKPNENLSNTSQNAVVTLPPPPSNSKNQDSLTTTSSPINPNLTHAPSYFAQQNNQTVQKIPSTGAPAFLLPVALSLLSGGIFIKRKSK